MHEVVRDLPEDIQSRLTQLAVRMGVGEEDLLLSFLHDALDETEAVAMKYANQRHVCCSLMMRYWKPLQLCHPIQICRSHSSICFPGSADFDWDWKPSAAVVCFRVNATNMLRRPMKAGMVKTLPAM